MVHASTLNLCLEAMIITPGLIQNDWLEVRPMGLLLIQNVSREATRTEDDSIQKNTQVAIIIHRDSIQRIWHEVIKVADDYTQKIILQEMIITRGLIQNDWHEATRMVHAPTQSG